MIELQLTDLDASMLAGEQGPAKQFAMRILEKMAICMQAESFISITSAHIDGCLFNGQVSLDFVNHALSLDGQVTVPTSLNVGSIDLLHPDLFQGDDALRQAGKEIMQAYLELGCQASFTCAPYQLPNRPQAGEHLAWAESNAIVFANSVLAARTNRYGDFIDLCAALTGRVPYCDLHTDKGRRGQHVFRLTGFTDKLLAQESLYAALGLFVGRYADKRIPVIVGLNSDSSEDNLKALGAASATSGSVALFHAVGITPEAATLEDALQHHEAEQETIVSPQDLKLMLAELTSSEGGKLSAVCLGTPHFSLTEFEALMPLLEPYDYPVKVEFYINTGRYVFQTLKEKGYADKLASLGIRLVIDTCTYITPIIRNLDGVMMTNSGKWAYYAPNNLGVKVAFGSLEDCVSSAFLGYVSQDDAVWSHNHA